MINIGSAVGSMPPANSAIYSATKAAVDSLTVSLVVAVLGDRTARGLVITAPSSFARLVAAVGTLDQMDTPDMGLFDRICAEIGDEILGPPGALPSASALAT